MIKQKHIDMQSLLKSSETIKSIVQVSFFLFYLSELRIRPRCRQLDSQMFFDTNRGQAKVRSKAGRGP
jgi:hypothetical protein